MEGWLPPGGSGERQRPSILHLYTQNTAISFVLMRKMLTVFQGYVIL